MWPRARRLETAPETRPFVWAQDLQASEPEFVQTGGHSHDPSHPAVDLGQVEQDAFNRGYAEGERAGAAAVAGRFDADLLRLTDSLDRLASARADMIRATERQMVELALAIARRIVLREVGLDRDLVVSMAHVALQRLEPGAEVTVRLNPDDYAVTVAAQTARWAGTPVTVVPDGSVPRGGCIAESAFGRVDAGVDAQLQEVALALLGAPEAEERVA